MNDKTYPTSVSLSPTARKVLSIISRQTPMRPAMSSIIESLLLGEIRLDDYDIPNDLKQEMEQELQRRKYDRS